MFLQRLCRSTYPALLHNMCQFMGNEGITDQRARAILTWPKGDVSSYGKGSCVEALRETSCRSIGMQAHMRKVHSKGRFHVRSHAAIERTPSSQLSLNRLGITDFSGTSLTTFEQYTP